MFIDELFRDPAYYVTVVFVVVASVVLHELGHALAATWEGDPTPHRRGHLTWNPVVHMGWLALGMAAVIGIAWGQTPVTPAYFRHRRWGDVIVSFAGPGTNLLLAIVSSLVFALVLRNDAPDLMRQFWWVALYLNVALFLFNLFPVPPFDGFGIANATFDLGELGTMLRRAQPWPMFIAFAFVVWGPFWGWARAIAEFLLRGWQSALGGAA